MNRKLREAVFAGTRVYPVITPEFCGGRDPLWIVSELVGAGATVLQLRVKSGPDRALLGLARECRKLTAQTGCLLILDDRVDVALAVGADGVHVGQDDLPVEVVRKLGPELLIGWSTHNREEVLASRELDVSCINIGPVFPTGTKVNPMSPLGLDTLRELLPLAHVPFSVMGGIKEAHLPGLRAIGVCTVAMVTQLTQAPDPAAVFTRMNELMGVFAGA